MNHPAIRISGVRKKFRDHDVLNGLTFEVPVGQTFAFLGRNAAGKTTTIRMLLGLLSPDEGSISVLGINPQTNPLAVRRRVGTRRPSSTGRRPLQEGTATPDLRSQIPVGFRQHLQNGGLADRVRRLPMGPVEGLQPGEDTPGEDTPGEAAAPAFRYLVVPLRVPVRA